MLRDEDRIAAKRRLLAIVDRLCGCQVRAHQRVRLRQQRLDPLLAQVVALGGRQPELAPEWRTSQGIHHGLRATQRGHVPVPIRASAALLIYAKKIPACISDDATGNRFGRFAPADGRRVLLRRELPDYFFCSAGGTMIVVEPESPLAPVSPVAPVAPMPPAAPVEPVEPMLPVEPVEPVAPVAPVAPAGPGVDGPGTTTVVDVSAAGAVAAGGTTTVSFFSQALSTRTESIAVISSECFMVLLSRDE